MSIHRARRNKIVRWLALFLFVLLAGVFAWVITSKSDCVSNSQVPDVTRDVTANEKQLPRLITLAPHLTEWIYELGAGDQLIATVDHSDYPPQALDLPRVGSAFALNLEKIVASKPDWVIYWADGGGALQIDRLRELGVPVLGVQINALEELPSTIGALCEAVRCPINNVEEELYERISRIRHTYRDRLRVRTFFQIGSGPLWTLGGSHLLSNALEVCGSQNLFASLSSPAAVVSPEQVIAGRPEVIVQAKTAVDRNWEKEWGQWWPKQSSDRPRFITLHPDISLRPGPRIFDAVEIFCRRVNDNE